jgi:hypothetical protein
MEDQTSISLKGSVDALSTQVKKLDEHTGNKITQEMCNKLDVKVELIIKANNLKRNK